MVIAGHKEAGSRARQRADEGVGAKRARRCRFRAVSLRADETGRRKAAAALDGSEIKVPAIAVINNVDVSCEQDPAAIKQALVRQLFSPVRWTETVERMANDGITLEIEMGPGKVLTGLAKRIDARVEGIHANDAASFEQAHLAQIGKQEQVMSFTDKVVLVTGASHWHRSCDCRDVCCPWRESGGHGDQRERCRGHQRLSGRAGLRHGTERDQPGIHRDRLCRHQGTFLATSTS